MIYTFLIVKDRSINDRPISQMTRKQSLAVAIAYKVEAEIIKKSQKKGSRGYKRG